MKLCCATVGDRVHSKPVRLSRCPHLQLPNVIHSLLQESCLVHLVLVRNKLTQGIEPAKNREPCYVPLRQCDIGQAAHCIPHAYGDIVVYPSFILSRLLCSVAT